MIKTLSMTLALGALIAAPAHSQNASDAVSDAMEAAEAAAEAAMNEEAGSESAETPVPEPYIAPPELIDFDMLQAKQADYPPASWVADEEGHAYYELDVDAQGAVTDCRILESTGFAALDAKTCEIAMERARFVPAFDEAGRSVASVHRDHQVWRKRGPQISGNSTIHVQYTVTAQGETTDCEVIEVSGEVSDRMRDTMTDEPCPGLGRNNQPPFRDADGNPVSKRVDLMIVVKSEDIADAPTAPGE